MINAGAHYVDRPVVRDRNLVTSRVPGDLPDFARYMVEALKEPRLVQTHINDSDLFRKIAL